MLTFVQAVETCLDKYTDFSGRAKRSELWWFLLFEVLVGITAGLISSFFVKYEIGGMVGRLADWLPVLAQLGLIIPHFAVGVRRLHDIGRTGWWMILALMPPLSIILFIFWVLQSEPRDNKYGPYTGPLDPSDASDMKDVTPKE